MNDGAGASTRTLTLPDGRSLAYCSVGPPAGRPVMHCHGGLSCRLEIAFADALCRRLGITWIAADRPGIGGSDPCSSRIITNWPEDISALADHLGIERFAVTGWSAGGPYALACAAGLPDRVTGLASVAGMAPLRGGKDIRALGMATDRFVFSHAATHPVLCAGVMQLMRSAPLAMTRASVRRMLSRGPDLLSPDTVSAIAESFVESLSAGTGGTVQDYRLLAGNWGFSLADVQAPATIWHGKADSLLPAEHASRLGTALPNARLRILDDAGHFVLQRYCHAIFDELQGATTPDEGSAAQ